MPRKAAPAVKSSAARTTAVKSARSPVVDKTSAAGRVRGARSTAALTTIQASIEKQFKLPKGSVALVAPGRRKMDDSAVVQDLRDRWATR